MEPLRRRTMTSSIWVILEAVIRNVIQLGSHILLAYWLSREMFGLIALVNLASHVLAAFSDVGIGPNIVQNRRGNTPAFLNTAWTFQIARGVVLFLAACAAAPVVAAIYGQERLLWLLPVAGCSSLASGFVSTAWYLANREMNLGRRTVLELISLLVGLAVTLSLAYYTRDVWAMVLGPLVTQVARMALSYLAMPTRSHRLQWDRSAAREILGFGIWIFITTLFGHLSLHVDKAMLGAMFSIEVLGTYHVAQRLAHAPQSLLGRLATTVIFPAISRRQDLPRAELRASIIRYRWPALLGGGAAVAVAVVFVDQFCLLIYDQAKFHDAVWIAPILLLGMWPSLLVSTMGPSLMAIGEPRYRAFASITRLLIISVAIYWGIQFHGLKGLVIATAAGSIVRHVTVCVGLARHGLLALRQDLISTLLFCLMVGLLLTVRYLLGWGLPVVEAFRSSNL